MPRNNPRLAHQRSALLLAFALTLPVGSAACGSAPFLGETPVLVKRAQMHMGTLVTISGVAMTEDVAHRAVDAGFKEVHRLEELLSTWRPTSELSRVNAAAGVRPVPVSRDTFEILKRSLAIAELTGGGFNVAIGPAVQLWSVTEQTRVPDASELAAVRPLVDLSNLTLDEANRAVYLHKPGMRLDVGGIGKGFAADRAAAAMRVAGALAGVVALSGDITTFGRMPEGKKFVFGIQHPRREDRVLGRIELEDEAISTAGDYERYFDRDGVRYHHILDPRTLQPARGCRSVTIVARDGTLADGLDTGIFVLGPERGMALIEQLPDVEGVIVDAQGKVHVSSGLASRFRLEGVPAQ
jgi:thiamine biosynthesis lipoprotein